MTTTSDSTSTTSTVDRPAPVQAFPNFPSIGITNDTRAADAGLDFVPSKIIESKQSNIMAMLAKLYSEPEVAVVRELLTNAFDSLTEAGADPTERPVHLHVPSVDEPWFTITDHGTGMSTDQMAEIYGNYGGDHTDDVTVSGQYGTGAKVPYAVAGRFTAHAVQDGVATDKVFTVSDTGELVNAVSGVYATSEVDGLTVTMPTKSDPASLDTWSRAVADTVRWCTPGTVTAVRGISDGTGDDQTDEEPVALTFSDNIVNTVTDLTFGVTTTDPATDIDTSVVTLDMPHLIDNDTRTAVWTVVMGTVGYRLPDTLRDAVLAGLSARLPLVPGIDHNGDTDRCSDLYGTRHPLNAVAALKKCPLRITLPVKTLEVTPDRQTLTSTDRTRDLLTEIVTRWLDTLLTTHRPVNTDGIETLQDIAVRVAGTTGVHTRSGGFRRETDLPLTDLPGFTYDPGYLLRASDPRFHRQLLTTGVRGLDWVIYRPGSPAKDRMEDPGQIDMDLFVKLVTNTRVRWMLASEYAANDRNPQIISTWRSSHDHNPGLVVVPDRLAPSMRKTTEKRYHPRRETVEVIRDFNTGHSYELADAPADWDTSDILTDVVKVTKGRKAKKDGTGAVPPKVTLTAPEDRTLTWVTADDLRADTVKKTRPKAELTHLTRVRIDRWGNVSTTVSRWREKHADAVKVKDIVATLTTTDPDHPDRRRVLVTGTKDDFGAGKTTLTTVCDVTPYAFLSGGRSPKTLAKTLGVDQAQVITVDQWRSLCLRNLTDSLTDDRLRIFAAARAVSVPDNRYNWMSSPALSLRDIRDHLAENPALGQDTDHLGEFLAQVNTVLTTGTDGVVRDIVADGTLSTTPAELANYYALLGKPRLDEAVDTWLGDNTDNGVPDLVADWPLSTRFFRVVNKEANHITDDIVTMLGALVDIDAANRDTDEN